MTNSKIRGGGGGEWGLTDINKKNATGEVRVSFGIHQIVKAFTVLSMGQIDHTILISEGYS